MRSQPQPHNSKHYPKTDHTTAAGAPKINQKNHSHHNSRSGTPKSTKTDCDPLLHPSPPTAITQDSVAWQTRTHQRTESTSCNVAKAWICDDATGFDRGFEDGFWSRGFCCYRIVVKENGFLFLFFHFSNYQSLCRICGFIFKIKTASF